MRWCWTKRRGGPGQSSARPDDLNDAAAKLEGDGEELEQCDEDHAHTGVVVDDVEDVVDSDEVATVERTKEDDDAARRGDIAATPMSVKVNS
jgi:hypothetical protein